MSFLYNFFLIYRWLELDLIPPPYTNNWLQERVTSDFPMAAAGGSWDCSYCYTTQLGLSQIQEKDGMVDIQVNKSEMCLPPSNYFDSYC